jgi:hypothetical protein
MRHTNAALAQHLAARWWWEVARRDDSRVARRVYRPQEVDGVYRLDEGAVLDAGCPGLDPIGVMALRAEAHGTAIQREMVPYVPDSLCDGLKTLCGIERMNALPALVCSDAALRQRVGFQAQHVRQGVCQRGAATRQGERTPGPSSPATLANPRVKRTVRALACVVKGAMHALATATVLGATVTGLADGTDLETTERDPGGGQGTRQRRIDDRRGREHAIARTVDGGHVLLWIDAAPKMPLAVKVGTIQAQETHGTRALVTHARAHRAGAARLPQGVVARGVWDGTDRWGLDPQGSTCVVPAKDNRAVTADARAQTGGGEAITVGRRVHSVRHGQGREAWTERLDTEVVGMTGLPPDAQDGTPEPGRQGTRRDAPANPIKAVVGRPCPGRDDGPAGHTGCLPNAPVDTPWRPFADDADRRLIEPGCLKEAKQPGAVGPPPPKTARAVRVHVVCTRRLVALATASRLPCAREDRGGEPVGWQRWRRQVLEQTRQLVIVGAQGSDGICHRAESSLRLGVNLKEVPPGSGHRQAIRAKSRLTMRH